VQSQAAPEPATVVLVAGAMTAFFLRFGRVAGGCRRAGHQLQ